MRDLEFLDSRTSFGLAFFGEVKIDESGSEAGVTEEGGDLFQGDSGVKQMGGIAVA